MANLLCIQSSSRGDQSYSTRAARAFLDAYRTLHPEDQIDILDLFRDEVPEFGIAAASGKYKIMYGQAQSGEEVHAWKAVLAAIDRFKRADKFVLSCPMWNFGIPYRLKQYLDVIMQPGHTFSFSPEEGYKGLVTGKPAMLFLARGGEYLPNTAAAGLDYQHPYIEWALQFMGFKDITAIVIEPTMQQGPQVADQKLSEAIAKATQYAKNF